MHKNVCGVERIVCSFETDGFLLGGGYEAEIVRGKCAMYLDCQF